jgi:ABC-type uncharacterized transport system substrate-binding protein
MMNQIGRRQFLLAVGAGSKLDSLPALAQQEKRVRRIGYFSVGILQNNADRLAAFRQGMTELHWVEGRDYVIDERQAILDRCMRSKVPAMFVSDEFVEAGGLMSYSTSFRDNYRRAAAYADKILKGAKPGDLPIEQPTKLELVLNLNTAKAMGIKFPQSILVRADRVIE